MQPRLYYCDNYHLPLPDGHKFPMEKYRLVRDLLASTGLFRFECAPFATREQLARVHTAEYLDDFFGGTLSEQAVRRIGFPWSEGLIARTLASVGGAVAASLDAMECGFGGNLAGGTHHAFAHEGSGFCVFNDIAVAIENLRALGLASRVAVVDLDVHQGDGTAAIFAGDPDVLTFSMHGANNFPFRKQSSRIDIALPNDTGDDEFLSHLQRTLPAVLDFAPDVVFFQAGVDALLEDKLGRLAMTQSGLSARNRIVFEAVRERDIPLAVCMGGGYSLPIEHSVRAVAPRSALTSAGVYLPRAAALTA
ncbi:MAG: histone deacetylase [Bryobacterales bacterium]|nr:histone deacetylase [Bryobacterales bacterium]